MGKGNSRTRRAQYKELEEEAIEWFKAQIILEYIKVVEKAIKSGRPEDHHTREWLEWAKSKVE